MLWGATANAQQQQVESKEEIEGCSTGVKGSVAKAKLWLPREGKHTTGGCQP